MRNTYLTIFEIVQNQPPEKFLKKLFLKIVQYSQENNSAVDSF